MGKKIIVGLLILCISVSLFSHSIYAKIDYTEITKNYSIKCENNILLSTEDMVEPVVALSQEIEPNIELSRDREQEYNTTYKSGAYQQIPFETEPIEIMHIQPYRKGTLPSAYDSRHLLPAVRNQNPFNTCWAFAAIAAAESSLINKQKVVDGVVADQTIDLSEYQLARLQYFNVDDPLKNTTGDKTIGMYNGVDITGEEPVTSRSSYLSIGGNMMFSTWVMAGWKAGADEKVAPYNSITSTKGLFADSIAYENKVHMQNAYWIPMEDIQSIKEMIMEYGTLATSYIHGDSAYNTETNAYFSGMTKQEASADYSFYGHGIALVGWDDNYSCENFNKSCRPTRNGAWLMRNSWGSEAGEAGYFWMSYEELTLDTVAMVFEFEDADNYDYNYQYDGSSGVQYISNSGAASIANVFEVKGEGNQILEAVGIGLKSTNVSYELQIYKDPKQGKPTSGTAMLAEPQKGSTVYTGYHTIKLEQPVFLEYGHTFSVVFSFKEKTKVFVDHTYENSGWIRFVSNTQPNQSFLFGNTWCYDLSKKYNVCARIKAYTNTTKKFSEEIFKAEPGRNGSIQMYNNGEIIYTSEICAPVRMEISDTTYICDGEIKCPEVTGVYDNQGRKIAETNYDVVYSNENAKAPGTYSIEVILKGKYYIGSFRSKYKIKINSIKDVKISSCTPTSIKINWKRNKNADGYYIYRSDTKNGTYKRVANIKKNKTTQYTNENLKSGKTYYFKVRSYVKIENEVYTSTDSEVVYGTTKLQKVKSLEAKSGKNYVKLNWKRTAGASGYEIYVYNKSKRKYEKTATIMGKNNLSKKIVSLKQKTTYKYKVRAFKKVRKKYVYGVFSSVKSVKTK